MKNKKYFKKYYENLNKALRSDVKKNKDPDFWVYSDWGKMSYSRFLKLWLFLS